uniref:DUF1725 domain-containing protein n=1 Tax=Panthera leo TaxID=9689 RepID=A0A8C9DBB4_PANLE
MYLLGRSSNVPPVLTPLCSSLLQEETLSYSPKCPSTDEWIKKLWFIYTMEYYLATRKNEIWPFVETWMELEKKDTICFHSYLDPEKLNRRPWGRGRKKKEVREGGSQNITDS